MGGLIPRLLRFRLPGRRPPRAPACADPQGTLVYHLATVAATIPDELTDLLTTNVLGHVSAVRRDGSMAHYLMWMDWDGEHVLTSSMVGSRKAAHWVRDPHVTVSVVDDDNDWRFLIIRGRVVETRPDDGLAFIDKMSERYTGQPYRFRERPREIFVIEPDHVIARTGR
jgi:PPOX class probable F420-dependent enzyme